jgi:CRP/FNR family transcriptional regulator
MTSKLKYWYLQNHKLFRNLSFSEIDSLCILKRFKKSKKNKLVELAFGDLNLEKSFVSNEYIKIVSDKAIICTFYREKLEAVMFAKPDFALNYIKFIGFNYKKNQNSHKNILFKDTKTRLLLLLNTIIEKENIENSSFILPNYLTQKDIAQRICTS